MPETLFLGHAKAGELVDSVADRARQAIRGIYQAGWHNRDVSFEHNSTRVTVYPGDLLKNVTGRYYNQRDNPPEKPDDDDPTTQAKILQKQLIEVVTFCEVWQLQPPESIDLAGHRPQANFMLADNALESRKLLATSPNDGWKVHPGTDRHDLVLTGVFSSFTVQFWCSRQAAALTVKGL